MTHPFVKRLRTTGLTAKIGRVHKILSTYVEADGPNVPLGTLCTIRTQGDDKSDVVAEVVAVRSQSVVLSPLERANGTHVGAEVRALTELSAVPVGDPFLGRVIDPLGRPLDSLGPIRASQLGDLRGTAGTALSRTTSGKPLVTGIRAVDGLLTLGLGQRIGLFAAAGVGKTTLLGQVAKHTSADRCVVCLVGERGREVDAFWSNEVTAEAKRKTTLVAATSDDTAAMRVRAGGYAIALAEHWRDEGFNVLLLVDSMTRLAMAMREMGLAAGEPPTVRAYTPGVFAAIPRLIERAGASRSGGSITAVVTVLAETDDVDDPIAEMLKSILDGHIVLSRELAERGHFPAIDIPRSISRLASGLMSASHRQNAAEARKLLAIYDTSRTMIETGIYVQGNNPEIDRSISRRPALLEFLRQEPDEAVSFDATRNALAQTVATELAHA